MNASVKTPVAQDIIRWHMSCVYAAIMFKPLLFQLVFGLLTLIGCSTSTPPDQYLFGCTNNCEDMCTPGACCMETCEAGPRFIECSDPAGLSGSPACPSRAPAEGAACACQAQTNSNRAVFEGVSVPTCSGYTELGDCHVDAYCVGGTWRLIRLCDPDGAVDGGADAQTDAPTNG